MQSREKFLIILILTLGSSTSEQRKLCLIFQVESFNHLILVINQSRIVDYFFSNFKLFKCMLFNVHMYSVHCTEYMYFTQKLYTA